jgi:hypothetical protein
MFSYAESALGRPAFLRDLNAPLLFWGHSRASVYCEERRKLLYFNLLNEHHLRRESIVQLEQRQTLSQKLVLTQTMRQSLDCLQLSAPELSEYVQEVALSNPLLDVQSPTYYETELPSEAAPAEREPLEVREAVEVLRGHGCPDLTGVCITLAANMLHLCNGWSIEEATKQAEEAINSGKAFEQMKRWIAAQGGDARVLDDVSLLPQASVQYELKAPQTGYIHHMDAQKIGESSAILGAGRKTKDDAIDFAAGIVLKEKTGAKVEQGQTLAVLHTNRPETIADAERVFLEAIRWGTDAPEAQPLIYGIVK